MFGCDDPVPGEIGGVILTIESIESEEDGKGVEIESLEVHYDRVEAIHRNEPDSEARPVVLDTVDRDILMFNRPEREILVAQFQVPIGYVEQIRIFPTTVFVHLEDGSTEELEPNTPALPSWEQTGWKITHHEDGLFEIEEDELTGVRGLLDFDDRFVPPSNSGNRASSDDPGNPNIPDNPGNPAGTQGQGSDTAQAATGWKVKPTLPAEEWQVNPLPHEPGVYADQLTIVFDDHVDRDRIDELNAAIDASVILNLPGSQWYRIKLPASINFEEAFEYYDQFRGDIIAIMPGINLGLGQIVPEEIEAAAENYELANLPQAWELASDHDPRGFVGSHDVTVAVFDTGLDLTHPDIYRNVKLNQENLPRDLFDTDGDGEPNIEDFDCDPPADEALDIEAGNGMITFRDLECEENKDKLWIDGEPPTPTDILASDDWMEELQDPRTEQFGDRLFIDELVGWNILSGSNDPTDVRYHGTTVSSVIGAEGMNVDEEGEPFGIAGVSWRVSLLPIRGNLLRFDPPELRDDPEQFEPADAVPHEAFEYAIRFADARGVDVLNISLGFTFESNALGFDRKCGREDIKGVVKNISPDLLADGFDEAVKAYDSLLDDPTDMLIVIASGNAAYDGDDQEVLHLPAQPMREVEELRDSMMVVGSIESEARRAAHSNYGSNYVDIYAPGVGWRVLTPPNPGEDETWEEENPWWECEDQRPHVCGNISGTSFAAPVVSGVAALMISMDESLRGDPDQLRQILLETGNETPGVEWCPFRLDDAPPGIVLDAEAAIEEVLP